MGTTAIERKHKRWPEALKREIVAASLAPGASVSVIARQYDVNANQLFSWRKRYRGELCPSSEPATPQLVRNPEGGAGCRSSTRGAGRSGACGGQSQSHRRSSPDRASTAADRKTDAPALRAALRAHSTDSRPD